MRILMVSAEGPPLQRRRRVDRRDGGDFGRAASGRPRSQPGAALIIERSAKTPRFSQGYGNHGGGPTWGRELAWPGILRVAARKECSFSWFAVTNFSIARAIYGEGGKDYEDNAARFIFFSKAVIELARRLTPAVQILHVHDWAPALVPVLVHAYHLPFSTVLTIHHVNEQGSFWGSRFQPNEFTRAIFYASRHRIFRADEPFEGRNPLLGQANDG